jgi:hypothetical protein
MLDNENTPRVEVPYNSDYDHLMDAISIIEKAKYNARIESVEGSNDTITLTRGKEHLAELDVLKRVAERLLILESYIREDGTIIKTILPF